MSVSQLEKERIQENTDHYAAIMAIETEINGNATSEFLRTTYQALKESYRERKAKKLLALGETLLMPKIRQTLEDRGETL